MNIGARIVAAIVFIGILAGCGLALLHNGELNPEHLHGYQRGPRPAQHWRGWSDAIIHRIHLRVLNHIHALAERAA